MAERSTIEWTDATWNPITGCTLVSEGCKHCYAATLAATRLKNHPSREGLARINAAGEAKFTGEVRFNEQWLDDPLRWTKPRMIFVCAHGDLFHESVPDEWIDQVFARMAVAPQHTFQVLTKRPDRARSYLSDDRQRQIVGVYANRLRKRGHGEGIRTTAFDIACDRAGMIEEMPHADIVPRLEDRPLRLGWPLSNLWLGTSIETQATANARIPHLLETPAAVRFASVEPLLGPLSLDDLCDGWKFIDALRGNWWHDCEPPHIERGNPRLDWVIVGGESGKEARPMHPDWARSLRDQCVAAGTSFFFKQWGEWTPGENVPAEITGWRANATYGPWVGGDEWLFSESDMGDPEADWDSEPDLYRVGKKAAGRLLDGRTWDEMPRRVA